jgi:hypothetical protein
MSCSFGTSGHRGTPLNGTFTEALASFQKKYERAVLVFQLTPAAIEQDFNALGTQQFNDDRATSWAVYLGRVRRLWLASVLGEE